MKHPLELEAAGLRALIEAALPRLERFLETLEEQPSCALEGAAERSRAAIEPLPETGTPVEALLDRLFADASWGFHTAGPGYLAYIPGGGLVHAGVADLIADVVNRYVGVWIAAPVLAQLEANVLRWFAQIVGYDVERARGVLTSGGSLANFSALVTARREKLADDFLQGTLYVSDQAHHSVQKAAVLAGFPPEHVRAVPVDERFRVRVEALARQIARDREAGFSPFLIVGNAGTTNTGAVDDLLELAELAAEEGLWLHADAAYGGFFCLTERGRARLRGLERADSITLDPHKGLFLPYGTGALLVREGEALRRAHALHAGYLPPSAADPAFWDFAELSPELSRDFRGLRVWLPLKLHGIAPFRAALEEKLDLAEYACEALRRMPQIELLAEPQLSTLAFRLVAPGLDDEALNRLNRAFLEKINARRRVFLSGTTLQGKFVVRICVLSFRTHREHLDWALEAIRAAADELLPRAG